MDKLLIKRPTSEPFWIWAASFGFNENPIWMWVKKFKTAYNKKTVYEIIVLFVGNTENHNNNNNISNYTVYTIITIKRTKSGVNEKSEKPNIFRKKSAYSTTPHWIHLLCVVCDGFFVSSRFCYKLQLWPNYMHFSLLFRCMCNLRAISEWIEKRKNGKTTFRWRKLVTSSRTTANMSANCVGVYVCVCAS